MTHELRSPISGITGVVDELSQGPLDSEQRELVALLDHAAHNQLRLIDGVLDYAKMEAGSLQLEKVAVNLPEFLDRECSLFRTVARTRGVGLSCEIASGVPATVRTDPTRLRQIIANLLSNAVKFTAQGEVRAEVSAEGGSTPENGVRLRFTVSRHRSGNVA